jgi:hypothetical protein
MTDIIDSLRNRMMYVAGNMADYSDSELRNIRNTADVFSMTIRKELAARDAHMVDEACALPDTPKTGG